MDNILYGRVRAVFVAVLALSIATLCTAAVVGGSTAVWVRGIIATVIAALLIALARRAFHGSRGAYRRMWLMSTVGSVAIVVIVALPHDGFPVWMKAEQSVIALLLAVAAVLVGRRTVRQAYGKSGEPAR